jgi:hypothetical protein
MFVQEMQMFSTHPATTFELAVIVNGDEAEGIARPLPATAATKEDAHPTALREQLVIGQSAAFEFMKNVFISPIVQVDGTV